MSSQLNGTTIAILVANGFNEAHMTAFQRVFQTKGAKVHLVSMGEGLVNGWAGDAWGHHHAADKALNASLAADYDLLVVPGGQRSIDKLQTTAHTRRFVGGFVNNAKPCAILEDAAELITLTGLSDQIGDSVLVTELGDDVDAIVVAVCDHFEALLADDVAQMAA